MRGFPLSALLLIASLLPSSFSQPHPPDKLLYAGHWGGLAGGTPAALAVQDGHAFIAEENGGVMIYRFEEGGVRPAFLSRFSPSQTNRIEGMIVRSNVTILAGQRLEVVNTSNRADPVSLGSIPITGEVLGLAGDDTHVFLSTAEDGLNVYQLASQAPPTRIANYPEFSSPRSPKSSHCSSPAARRHDSSGRGTC